ncbi:MAG TPA: PEP/pyruvate-binding domain-containing protein [Candidatus Nanoarchaeia archaeon]|nr:PEP/pyruvate-binding domain-containing protein [Candidatus Nanoarchaeia archaeon]
MTEKEGVIKWFSEIKKEDREIVGDKAAIIGQMQASKFPIPAGFVVTFAAYKHFMGYGGLKEKINFILEDLNIGDKNALKAASQKIIDLIEKTEFHKEVEETIAEAYELLDVDKEVLKSASAGALSILKNSREPVFVAVRKSVRKEHEFIRKGKREYYLNVKGFRDLLQRIKKVYASMFGEEEIYDRLSKKIENSDFEVALVIQKMVNADKSGTVYTKSKVENSNNLVVKGLWGLGVAVNWGVRPDTYIVNRENMEILSHEIETKEFAITRDSSGNNCTVKLTAERAMQQTLTNHEIKIVSQFAMKLEEQMKKSQKVDFSISNGEIFIISSEDLRMESAKKNNDKKEDIEDIEKKILKELEVEEYRPGAIKEKDEDMPRLNDAILVEEQQEMDDENRIDLV